jgi:hypothetical protein
LLLTATDDKKPDFETGLGFGSLRPLVLANMVRLKINSDDLAQAIVSRLTAFWASKMPATREQLNAAF